MKTYIIHVSDAYEREEHIRKELSDKNLDLEFIHEGDIKDLSKEVLDIYFTGGMHDARAAVSCAYKHILTCEKTIKGNEEIVLVLEDDIYCYKNFDTMLKKILIEIKERSLKNFFISLEDSTLRYIPGSRRIKGQYLYHEKISRTTGGYLLDKEGAQSILNGIKKNKIDRPVDHYYDFLTKEKQIDMFWSQPAIICQGSIDGSIKTLIGTKRFGFLRTLSYNFQKRYKRLLYRFR